MSYKKDLKKIMILYPDIEVTSSEEYKDLINIHNVVESTFGNKFDLNIVKDAFLNKNNFKTKNLNDYYYLVFSSLSSNKELKKIAYPSMWGQQEVDAEFDLDKWAGLVYKIYDAVQSNDMSLKNAIDYYSGSLDKSKEEDLKFKQWIEYYQNKENLKYSNKESDFKKEAFQFPLSSPGFYQSNNAVIPSKVIENAKDKLDDKNKYKEWKQKLYSAIRRIDKLLRQSDDFVNFDSQRDLADLLHQFDQEVRSLRHQKTASDLAFKYANKFKKAGFKEGFDEFIKYSQEVENLDLPESNSLGQQNVEQQKPIEESIDEVRGLSESGIANLSGARENEYEDLSGNISLGDAVSKLEEVAARLSDRRTIRLLAEFDIMLDKIGIAPMFPELAEAQSKLIDGYSYALTRVTKMLGMLSSGKSLVEISESRQKELDSKVMKEVNKTFEPEEDKEGIESIQEGANQIRQEPPEKLAPEQPSI